jgi:hypothetical protein
MEKDAIAKLSNLALLRHVFGLHPGQTLSEFVKEVGELKNDATFISEVRAYALA